MTKTDVANIVMNWPPMILLINLVGITLLVLGAGQVLRLIAHLVVWMGIY